MGDRSALATARPVRDTVEPAGRIASRIGRNQAHAPGPARSYVPGTNATIRSGPPLPRSIFIGRATT